MLLGKWAKLIGKTDFLHGKGSAVRFEFVALQKKIKEPVVCIRRTLARAINQEFGRGRFKNPHFRAEFVVCYDQLREAFSIEGIERFPPLAGGVIPEHQAVALKGLIKAVVNAFHVSYSRRGAFSSMIS